MKIQVTGSGNDINLTLPTKLIFSRFVLKRILKHSSITNKVENLSPEMVDRLVEELKRIKKKHGSWELVEVHSADGEHVTITL